MVTVGGSEAIDVAMRAMLNPGDEVLIPQPSYVSYLPCVTLADGVPVIIELEEKDQFKLTPEKLLEKITDKTKILVLPFPNNPTGAIMEKHELEEIAKMNFVTEMLNRDAEPAPQSMQDKHFMRKHGPNAYYGQR